MRPLPEGGGLSVCLAYPNEYSIGMASLGFQVVRRIMSDSGCSVDRTFLPDTRDETDMRAAGMLLPAWETQRPARQFDVLAFSVPFELDFVNLVKMLLLSGIPPRSADRHQGHPLVIAGGAAVTINPSPLAAVLDAVVLGESERILPRLVELVRVHSGDRGELLRRLADERGVFVPSIHTEHDSRRIRPPELSAAEIAIADAVAANSEFGEAVLVEVGRGCSMGCRFCWAGWACRPVRAHDVEAILAAVDEVPGSFNRFGLIATSHFDNPSFLELIRGLRARGKRITISALRIDHVNEELLAALAESGTKSISLAPETGSDKLRKKIGKRFDNHQVLNAVKAVSKAGLSKLKLYFLLGLPGETDEDIDNIADLAGHVVKAAGRRLKVSLSVNFFVPKPGTPFGDEPLLEERELQRKRGRLKKDLSKIKGVGISAMAPWQAIMQTLLSRGGIEVGEYILKAASDGLTQRQFLSIVPEEVLAKYVFLNSS